MVVPLVMVAACKGSTQDGPRGVPRVEGERDPDAAATIPSSGASSDAGANAGSDAGQSFLPPIDDVCTSDADCTVVAFETSGPSVCCPSCTTTPVTKAWAKRAETCRLLMKKSCVPLACPLGPMRPACKSGHCVALP